MATVKAHVTRVLTKLAVRDRVHAVVLAYEIGGSSHRQRLILAPVAAPNFGRVMRAAPPSQKGLIGCSR